MTAESQRVPAIFVFLLAVANLVIRSEIDARDPSLESLNLVPNAPRGHEAETGAVA
jgi:hypothetical protein